MLAWVEPRDRDFAQVQITWSPADGVSQPQAVGPGTSSHTITGLTNGTEYTFVLVAVYNRGGASKEVITTATPIQLRTFVQFIGNSITYVQDVPGRFRSIVRTMGYPSGYEGTIW